MLTAPMTRPGVVLSQPPISTAPSSGWLRSSSSVSMARKLRYIMVDGLTKVSDSEIAGSSIGKPPACSTPRLTFSARDAQMRVARIDLAPGVDDADHRLALPIVGVVADLAQPRAVAERAHVGNAEPAVAAEVFGLLAGHFRPLDCNCGASESAY